MTLRGGGMQTPSAVVLAIGAVLGFGASFGAQLNLATYQIHGLEVHPSGYWLVYSTIVGGCMVFLIYAVNVLRLKMHSLFLKRTRNARLSGSEIAGQYLLHREIRDRNRPPGGAGGPVPKSGKLT